MLHSLALTSFGPFPCKSMETLNLFVGSVFLAFLNFASFPACACSYNAMVEPQHRIPTYDRPMSTLGILIGNTKRLWPAFLDHLRVNPGWDMSQNPLDEYVRESVMKIT